ncbi:MAG: hypothetical protein AAFP20_18380 [Cyanobacteria bacterium J06614_10]
MHRVNGCLKMARKKAKSVRAFKIICAQTLKKDGGLRGLKKFSLTSHGKTAKSVDTIERELRAANSEWIL